MVAQSETTEIIYHIVSPYFGCRNLLWALRQNAGPMRDAGLQVPRPSAYQKTLTRVAAGQIPPEEAMTVVPMPDAGRVFLADRMMMMPGPQMWDGVLWFPSIGERAARVRAVFPDAAFRLFVTVANPARLLSAVLASGAELPEEPGKANPFWLSWADLVEDLRQQVPDAPLTLWCAEESPFIWTRLMRDVAGLDAAVPLTGTLTPLQGMISDPALERLETYLAQHGHYSEAARARVITKFLERFAGPEALEEEIAIPGWTEASAADMDAQYDADIGQVAQMHRVHFITLEQDSLLTGA